MVAMPSASRHPAKPTAARFEARVTRAFAWALFGGLWAKLLVAVLLSQPTLDAEVDSVYNRAADQNSQTQSGSRLATISWLD